MDIFEQKDVLNSLSIIVDNREQNTERARERYKHFGCEYGRATLNYGDYTFQATLPSGAPLYDPAETISPAVVVERKMHLDELAQCFTHDRERFRKEFERARAAGARVYLLVENATWEHLLNGKYRSKFTPKAFEASITAYMARYDMRLIFCKAETSGGLIREILYRELKERLERGEFG